MLTFDQILRQYPENLRGFPESILKEYLQYKILNSIFNSEYANKLAFVGGSALRIVYGSPRFSEDLNFDKLALSEAEFKDLSKIMQRDLALEGLDVEVDSPSRTACVMKIRLPKLLFDVGLFTISDHKILIVSEHKITVRVDPIFQNFTYKPEKPLLNKFDVFTQINAAPKNLLLSQKIFASVSRKHIIGRDFFDIVFLRGIGAKPDFAYLKNNIGVGSESGLKKYIMKKTAQLNFENLARDVEPMLFNPRDKKRVLLFREFVDQWL